MPATGTCRKDDEIIEIRIKTVLIIPVKRAIDIGDWTSRRWGVSPRLQGGEESRAVGWEPRGVEEGEGHCAVGKKEIILEMGIKCLISCQLVLMICVGIVDAFQMVHLVRIRGG